MSWLSGSMRAEIPASLGSSDSELLRSVLAYGEATFMQGRAAGKGDIEGARAALDRSLCLLAEIMDDYPARANEPGD